jgi:tRNA pseudouridine55 synthase
MARSPSDRRPVEGRTIDGILLVDKPVGVTSHDVVNVARRAVGTRRIGHAGTLDPFATGLLVLLIGHATRLLPYIDGEPKVYDATIAFGTETDTDDATGAVVRTAEYPAPERVREALGALTGTIDQVPPAYSAKQVRGRRAYTAARQGAPLALAPARVTVHDWRIRDLRADHLQASIVCGGGTYIRALARDLGRLCGSAAHLAELRRTRSGGFEVTDALPFDALREGRVEVRPAREAVPHLPSAALSDEDVVHVRHGRAIPAVGDGAGPSTGALVDGRGRLVAIAARDGAMWRPRVVLPDA